MSDALVIGGGPAGLMAADVLSAAGANVTVADAMPTMGRKLLMAGKSGLNLTKDEPFEAFLAAYGESADYLRPLLQAFGPAQVRDWAEWLGQPVFTGSTGRVFPKAMKASPLLRAWYTRLRDQGVTLRTGWRWRGWEDEAAVFDTPDGTMRVTSPVTVLALGGASWRRLGSDGAWVQWMGPITAPFQPSNVGLSVAWSDHMHPFFGQPVKGAALRAGDRVSRGEFILSAKGLEGGGIYELSAALRHDPSLTIDLFPDKTVDDLRVRLDRPRGKASLRTHLRKALKLEGARLALLNEWGRPFPDDLAPLLKALPVRHQGFRPLDEAISTVGGVVFDALDQDLMLRDRPGIYCAGEMVDWDAPTGGYLITACLAMGRWAGSAAARRLQLL